MIIRYHATLINAKRVHKVLITPEEKYEVVAKTIKRRFWFDKKVAEKVPYTQWNCILVYTDQDSKETTFTWHAKDRQTVEEAYEDISKQINDQQEQLTDRVIEQALFGDNNGTAGK